MYIYLPCITIGPHKSCLHVITSSLKSQLNLKGDVHCTIYVIQVVANNFLKIYRFFENTELLL